MLKHRMLARDAGFTLIEIAVVLGILGFLAFLLAPLATSLISASRVKETRGKVDPIKGAIVAFVVSNNRLPCPAIESLPSTDPNYGREATTPGTCTGTTALVGGGARGVVPWLSLGLNIDAVSDGFGRFYTFAVTTAQTAGSANTVPGMVGVFAVHSSTPIAPANQLNAGNLAVYVLVSHGPNGFGAFNPVSGAQTPFSGGNDELANANTIDTTFVDKEFSDNAANPFDDIVTWVPPRDLLTALSAFGVKTPQAAMAEKLQIARAALLVYMTADNADPDGGLPRTVARRLPCADVDNNGDEDCNNLVGTLPYSALGLPLLNARDSWGRAIRYAVSAPGANALRLLKSDSSSNAGIQASTQSDRVVTLSSDGPDGVQGNADDISLILTAPELASALMAASVTLDP